MLAYLEEVPREHVQKEIQGGLAGYGIHLVLEDAGKAPVFGGFGRHLDLSGDAVRDVADEFQQFRIRVLVAQVLGDKLFRHFRHMWLIY